MTKQIINIVKLNELYNILFENEKILPFEVKNYPTNKEFIENLKNDKKKYIILQLLFVIQIKFY